MYMQNSQLNRVINLVKRTGDKTVIMDNESDAVMMLMDLGAYEKMLDHTPARENGVEKLTEEEMLEKINRDVAIWRASNDKERSEIIENNKDINLGMTENSAIILNKYSNVNGAAMAGQAEQEHSAHDIVAEEEEEKFYLEPVE